MAKASQGSNPTDAPPAASGPSFEDAIEQVEQIIDRIERGEQGLERSIADYERGAGLLKKCREILARSEQRIQEIEADLTAASAAPGASPVARPVSSQPLKRAGGSATNASAPASPASTPPAPSSDDGDDTPF